MEKSDKSQPQESQLPEMVQPGDPSYDTARLAWNLAADQRPALICTAGSVAEVSAAVRHAVDRGLRIAAQTTGHMAGALPSLEDTLLLKPNFRDRKVEIDAEALTARIVAGTTWGEVVEAAAPHGLTAMHGSSPSVGVIGYLLGGGLSFYAREHGFATNRVRSFEIVTADGETRVAGAGEDADLFWALRGGGGQFGVVTGVEVELLPIAEVFAGATFWPASEAADVFEVWRSWTTSAPDSVTSTFRILRLPPLEEVPEPIRGVPVACVDGVALDEAAGAELAGRLDGCAEPLMGGWGMQPSAAVTHLHGDPEDPLPGVGDSILLDGLDAGAGASLLAAAGEGSGSQLIVAELRHLGGALGRPAEGGGILSHTDAEFMLFGTGIAFDPDSAGKSKRDVDRLLDSMDEWKSDRRLYGFSESRCSLADFFEPDAVARLTSLRDRHDPDRRFVAPNAAVS